jgi:hypothetical protein
MEILSSREVHTAESQRIGVQAGWYCTKASGTFVSGPHATEQDCAAKIAELNPPPAKKRRMIAPAV